MSASGILPLILTYRYWILLPLAFIEGPMVALMGGMLVSLGYLSLVPTFLIMILGDFIPDMAYYAIGRKGRQKNMIGYIGRKFPAIAGRMTGIERLWRTHTFKAVALSKWAYGLSTGLLITAGLSHVPIGRYTRDILIVIFLQYGVLMAIGYQFGASSLALTSSLKDIAIAVALLVAGFIIASLILGRYAKKSIIDAAR